MNSYDYIITFSKFKCYTDDRKKVTENIVGDRKIVIFVRSFIRDDDFINQKDLQMVRKIKAVIALLEANGWVHIRTRGDHRIFRKDGEPRSIPIPGNPNDDLAIGTLKSILKQAGLSESDFDKI